MHVYLDLTGVIIYHCYLLAKYLAKLEKCVDSTVVDII
jgi:hypothetical protein